MRRGKRKIHGKGSLNTQIQNPSYLCDCGYTEASWAHRSTCLQQKVMELEKACAQCSCYYEEIGGVYRCPCACEPDVEKSNDEALKPIPVERRPDQCTCYRSMTTGKFEDGHEYPCQGGEQR